MRYEPPLIITIDNAVLAAAIGPSISCTGFGGAVNCD